MSIEQPLNSAEIETRQRSGGSTGHWLGYRFPINKANGRRQVGTVSPGLTTTRQTEEALRLSEAQLASIINSATDAIITLDHQHKIVIFNTAAEKMFGYRLEEVKGRTIDQFIPPSYRQLHSGYIHCFGQTGITTRNMMGVLNAVRRNGQEFPIEATISQVENAGQKLYTVIIRDITERKKAEEALEKSEARLRQSQKMEAVGQLAGGVAHDFNNLLTAITGYSDLILADLDETTPLYQDVKEIRLAAERAANLTRQLLAFSRRQVLQPTILNLNEVVGNVNRLLRRLIGENIELVTVSTEELEPIKADRGQLEQVIVNLAVNARDAMPEGGKLIFETCNIELTEEYHQYYPEVTPGRYVRLAVSDTGSGMSKAVRQRIFEPFFTTKEWGKGTGLGLATVYGIIKQSGGYIEVYSEEGLGTTFKIYLPTIKQPSESEAAEANRNIQPSIAAGLRSSGQNTVLLVEDEEGVRNLAARVLEQYGYKVMLASNGREALQIAEGKLPNIDLLLTDVVLPKLNGPELAKRLLKKQPGLKVVYMSGYTDGLLNQNEEIISQSDLNHWLIQKPFIPQQLAQKIRERLEN
jgi:PAS domain S-box-containing protein